MSSLNRPFLRRIGVLLPLLGLGGCIEEVRPLYGSGSFLANGAQAEKMQSVAVDEISGRLGHYLGDDLQLGLNGTGAPTDPQYHLVVTLSEGIETPLIDTVEGFATSGDRRDDGIFPPRSDRQQKGLRRQGLCRGELRSQHQPLCQCARRA